VVAGAPELVHDHLEVDLCADLAEALRSGEPFDREPAARVGVERREGGGQGGVGLRRADELAASSWRASQGEVGGQLHL